MEGQGEARRGRIPPALRVEVMARIEFRFMGSLLRSLLQIHF